MSPPPAENIIGSEHSSISAVNVESNVPSGTGSDRILLPKVDNGGAHIVTVLQELDDRTTVKEVGIATGAVAQGGLVSDSPNRRSVEDIIAETHGKRVCSIRDFVAVLVVIISIGIIAFILNTQEEKLTDVATLIEDLGFWGHLVFFLLYLWVGIPIGYNWSTLTALVGWAYGWVGLVDVVIGSQMSALNGYYLDRYCFKSWVERKIAGLPEKKRTYFDAAKSVIEGGSAGFLMQIVVRVSPVPYGISTAFLSSTCNINIFLYLTTTLIGTTPGMITMVNLGVVVRRLGSFSAAAASSSGRVNIIVQAALLASSIIGSLVFARLLTVYALPKLIRQDEDRKKQIPSSVVVSAEVVGSSSPQSSSEPISPSCVAPETKEGDYSYTPADIPGAARTPPGAQATQNGPSRLLPEGGDEEPARDKDDQGNTTRGDLRENAQGSKDSPGKAALK